MTNYRSCFSSFSHITLHKVEIRTRASVTCVGKGDVILKLNTNGKLKTCTLKNVLFISEFGFQLISIRVLGKLGLVTQFGNNRVMFSKQGKIAATGTLSSKNLYVLDLYKSRVLLEKP